MSSASSTLTSISNDLADAVASAAPTVVQVHGRRRPVSGVVYAENVVVTTARALGREDGLHVRGHDGETVSAELATPEGKMSTGMVEKDTVVTP